MGLPTVSITLSNGNLGLAAASSDAVAGLVVVGVAKAGCPLLTPKQVFGMADVTALGFTAAADVADSTQTYAQIADFYAAAGEGRELWIMTYAAATTQTQLCDPASTTGLRLIIDAAGGRIRLLAISRPQAAGYVPAATTNGVDIDATNAITNLQSLQDEYFGRYQPFVGLLDGRDYTGTPANLRDNNTLTSNGIAINIANRTGKKHADQGLLLGRLASIPVMRNIGRRKDPAATLQDAYLTSGGKVSALSPGTLGSIHDKGYILLIPVLGKAGFFWNDDPTLSGPTDDYRGLARRRTINKVVELTAKTYLEELLDEVDIDPSTGKLSPSLIAYFAGKIQNVLDITMTNAQEPEVSGVAVFIDPKQKVLSTNQLNINLAVLPVGYAKQINVKVGFATSL